MGLSPRLCVTFSDSCLRSGVFNRFSMGFYLLYVWVRALGGFVRLFPSQNDESGEGKHEHQDTH